MLMEIIVFSVAYFSVCGQVYYAKPAFSRTVLAERISLNSVDSLRPILVDRIYFVRHWQRCGVDI